MHKTTRNDAYAEFLFRLMQRLPVAISQLHTLGFPWTCSDGNVGQDDRTLWRIASLVSERRSSERFSPVFFTPCAKQEGYSTNLQSLGKTQPRVELQGLPALKRTHLPPGRRIFL